MRTVSADQLRIGTPPGSGWREHEEPWRYPSRPAVHLAYFPPRRRRRPRRIPHSALAAQLNTILRLTPPAFDLGTKSPFPLSRWACQSGLLGHGHTKISPVVGSLIMGPRRRITEGRAARLASPSSLPSGPPRAAAVPHTVPADHSWTMILPLSLPVPCRPLVGTFSLIFFLILRFLAGGVGRYLLCAWRAGRTEAFVGGSKSCCRPLHSTQ